MLILSLWQAILYKFYYFFSYLFRFFIFDEEEVGLLAVARIRLMPLVEGMGTHDESAGLSLPEDAS